MLYEIGFIDYRSRFHISTFLFTHEVNLSKLAMGNFTLNLVNYSILHIDIDFVLVGMIANISDCEDIVFISNNNVFPFEIKFSWLKNGISCHLYTPVRDKNSS